MAVAGFNLQCARTPHCLLLYHGYVHSYIGVPPKRYQISWLPILYNPIMATTAIVMLMLQLLLLASTVIQQTDTMATATETVTTESLYENGETAIMATAMLQTAIMVATATMMKHEATAIVVAFMLLPSALYHEPKP